MIKNNESKHAEGDGLKIPESWLDDVTAIIKTFERPRALDRLISSIRDYYPTLKIIVADDSEIPSPRQDVEYFTLPFDSGVGRGRNYLLDQVNTKYVITLDDDFVFTEKTRLENFYSVLETTPFNLVGGVVMDGGSKRRIYHGSLDIVGDTLFVKKGVIVDYREEVPVFDIVLQFFMAETRVVKKVRWHDGMKTVEHEEFFLRGKNDFLITHLDSVVVDHFRDLENERYMRYRNREEFLSILYEENNLKDMKTIKAPQG